MPVYTYRREDGTTFDIRQKFLDDPLEVCPTTGQPVSRVIQPAGVIFKGSGFYVTDNKGASNPARPANGDGSTESTETTASDKSETTSSKADTSSSAAGTEKKSIPEAKAS